jgi:hypothetical protein
MRSRRKDHGNSWIVKRYFAPIMLSLNRDSDQNQSPAFAATALDESVC